MDAQTHKIKYITNKNVADKNFVKGKKNNEWQVTVIFYAALHYIEGSFPKCYRTESHTQRANQIKILSKASDTKLSEKYSNIKVPYNRLYKYSRQARYYDIPINDNEIKKAKQYLKIIEENLEIQEQ